MTQPGSISELIELAVTAERNAATVYQYLAGLFYDYPELVRFWQEYSMQEVEHARWLHLIRDRSTASLLAMPADPVIWDMVEQLQAVSTDSLVKNIETLQDAWELANELEHGETNTVFEFLIAHFSADAETQTFLRSQLNDHLTNLLDEFPARYRSPAVRAGVRAIRP